MSGARSFTHVDDQVLIDFLRSARRSITYVAPGITDHVAKQLLDCARRIGPENVNIVLDVDPEICRLGYGDIKGLLTLNEGRQESGLLICHQPGVRVGLLIADDQTVIYSPVPLLIEAGSMTPDKPNGIIIAENSVASLKEACGADGSPAGREIGMDPAQTPDIEDVQKDLERNPPKKFDVARAERVFNSQLQYVDFAFEDYKLSQKTISIPSELTGITRDRSLLERWRNNFRLFSGSGSFQIELPTDKHGQSEILTEQSLEAEKKTIIKEFLLVIPRYGTFILRNRRAEFDARIEHFKERVELFRSGVIKQLTQHLSETKENLIRDLVPQVIENPPAKWKKTMISSRLSETDAKERLTCEIDKLFGEVDQLFSPNVRTVYKNVAYETMLDAGFQAALAKCFPPSELKTLFKEYMAAPESQ